MSKNEGVSPKLTASSTTSLLPNNTQISLKKRVVVFAVAVFNIFVQYLYFTVPMSFLANEIIEVIVKFPQSKIFIIYYSHTNSNLMIFDQINQSSLYHDPTILVYLPDF